MRIQSTDGSLTFLMYVSMFRESNTLFQLQTYTTSLMGQSFEWFKWWKSVLLFRPGSGGANVCSFRCG